jgi:hypothetical protein
MITIKKALLIFLILLAIAMIIIGIKAAILPPVLTGIGFILITLLIYIEKK